VNGAII